MKSIALTLSLALTMFAVSGSVAWAAESSSEPLVWKNVGGSDLQAGLIGAAGARYESNVYMYSSDNIESYDAGVLSATKFADVQSIDDWIQDYTAGAFVEKKIVKSLPTRAEFRANWNVFSENDKKDYEQYSVEVKQNLTRSNDIVKFRYTRIPDYFIRNLFDADTSTYARAALEKDMYSISYWKRLTHSLKFRILYQLEDNDYESAFDERDNLTHNVNAKLIFDDVLPNLKVAPYYLYVGLNAEGADADALPDDDISYDQHAVGVSLNYELMTNWYLTSFYEYAFRNFTTDNSVATDPLHSGREDDIFSVGVGIEYEITRNINVGVKYSYVESNPTTDLNPSLTTLDDVLGYSNHSVTLGAQVNF